MRKLLCVLAFSVAGCASQAEATKPVPAKAVKAEPRYPRLAEGTKGLVMAGRMPIAEMIPPDSGWQKGTAEFTYPWLDSGDEVMVLDDTQGKEDDMHRPVFIRVVKGKYADNKYDLPREFISTPR